MRLKLLCASLFLSGVTAAAAGTPVVPAGHHIILAPACLVRAALPSATPLATQEDKVLLDADEHTVNQLIQVRDAAVRAKNPDCGGFRDVTERFLRSGGNPAAFMGDRQQISAPPVFKVQYSKQVNQLLSATNPQNMWDSLTKLTAFQDRYANSKTGTEASGWIKKQLNALISGRKDATVYTVPTHGYKQPSVILKIGTSSDPGIVISGHMDTVSGWNGMMHMPGADDDGSGSVTVLEAARTVLASGLHFKKPLYFMWYAAEEEGLVGSSSVVSLFQEKNIPVATALHFDMTGYQKDAALYLLKDYTHPAVTDWLATLIKTYVKKPVGFTKCGYACSDHASWTQAGIPAGAATETRFEDMNDNLHTSRDTMEKLSLAHMTDYLKLTLAFAVETAEPVN